MKLINPRLLRQSRSSRIALGLTIAFGFGGGVSSVIQAWILSQVFGRVFLGGLDLWDSAPRLGLLLLIFLGRAVLIWAGEISAKRVALEVKTSLRERLYTHIQKLGPLYTRGERTGELVHTATEGVEALDAYFSQYLPQLVLAGLVPLTFLFFIFPLDRLTGFVLLLTAPLIPVFMVLIGDRADVISKRQWRTLSRMSAHFLDVLQGLTTLKLFGRSQAQINVIRQISEQFQERTMGVLRVAFLSALVLEMVATLSTAIVAVEIGLRLLFGQLAFEQAIFVLLLAPEFYLPLRLLGTRFHAGVAGVTAAARIFEILDDRGMGQWVTSNKVTREPKGYPSYPITDHAVTFDAVSYTYPDGRVALQGITFTIKPGQKVALVGPSGAGKSTIAALLQGWMEPDSGRVLRGTPDREIAWLSQNPYLFHDTIAANIRIARPEASIDQVIAATKAAHADDFISELVSNYTDTASSDDDKIPTGFHTMIGERGTRLSGGQAQRLALARAFLMDASLVILDEPTAHLDPELESQIAQSLENLLENRSALIIAHRLNTIRNADKIIVLDQGRIVQQGTYETLITQDGLFHSLVNATIEPMAENRPKSAVSHQTSAAPTVPSLLTPLSAPRIPRATLPRLLAFLRPHLGWIILSISLGFLTIASNIGLMGTSAYIISAAALHPSIAVLQLPIVGVRFFGITRGLFRYLERLISHQTTFRVLVELRVWFYQKLEPLAPARLQQYRSAELLSGIVADINSLENFYIRVVAPPLTALFVAILTGFLLISFAPQLALAMWIFLSLGGILLPCWTFCLARGLGVKILVSRAALSNALVDGIQGLPDLLAFGRGPDQLQRIRDLGGRLTDYQARYALLSGLGAALLNLISNLGIWTVLVLAIPFVSTGQVAGTYLAVITLIALASFEAIQPLPTGAQYLKENLRAAGQLFEIIDTEPEVKPPAAARAIPMDKTITVCNLAFKYPIPDHRLQGGDHEDPFAFRLHPAFNLRSISFTIPVGKHLAIVGPSGSGKTTLVNLLLRFWDYHAGKIYLGGQDIRSFDPEELRCQIAVVSQYTHLFNTSLRENLLIARPQATDAEITRAVQGAQIQQFIETLPQGYHTLVGEYGLRLSAGERQRIAIARTLLKDAPILILDEPTANLDPITESAVLTSIHRLMQNRSTLLVSHRLVAMEWMDEILVLNNGEIVQRGSHAELLAQGGLYNGMWRLQQAASLFHQ